jgi:hypothetical protein
MINLDTTNENERQPIVIDRLTAQTAQAMLKQAILISNSNTYTTAPQNQLRRVDYSQLERFATNGLGVLQEQGVYSLLLYFFANSGTETNALYQKDGKFVMSDEKLAVCTIVLHLLKLLPQLGLTITLQGAAVETEQNPSAINSKALKQEVLDYFATYISGNLNHLLLIKSTFTQTLTYLRYGAKALEEPNEHD